MAHGPLMTLGDGNIRVKLQGQTKSAGPSIRPVTDHCRTQWVSVRVQVPLIVSPSCIIDRTISFDPTSVPANVPVRFGATVTDPVVPA